MSLIRPSCDELYGRFPRLDRNIVLQLIEWHKNQPHLPNCTELEAIVFLHTWDYDIDRTKKCMDMYYTMRTHTPEFFANRSVFGADIVTQMQVLGFVCLPELTDEGFYVILCKLIDPQPSKFNFIDAVKLFNMILDFLVAKNGIIDIKVVVDMQNWSFSHLTKVNITAMRNFLYYLQEAIPLSLRAVHYINTPSFMDKMLAMVRPFIKKELMNLIHTHTILDSSFHSSIPKRILPTVYGGSSGSITDMIGGIYKEIQSNGIFFIEEETTKRVNEKLRPGKPKTENDHFGHIFSLFSNGKSKH